MFEFRFPKIGEAGSGGTVVRWLKRVGEYVQKDEPLIEVTTDKIATELASPQEGRLTRCLVQEGEEVQQGQVLAILDSEGESSQPQEQQQIEEETTECPLRQRKQGSLCWLSPAVVHLAKKASVDLEEIQRIPGSGTEGRITKKDVEKYLSHREAPCILQKKGSMVLSPLRKAIASSLSKSSEEIPHAFLITEVDVTDLLSFIAKEKETFFVRYGVKLTITSFFIQCLALTAAEFPFLYSSLDGDNVLFHEHVNVGVAVDLNKEGVVVPVIHHCESLRISSIAKLLSDLSSRARAHKLERVDTSNGNITITNFGMTGVLIGLPIIRYPEAAILGVGAIQKRLVVRDDDSIAVRKMVYITLTFDHRLIDGIYGGEFLSALKNRIESVTLSSENI